MINVFFCFLEGGEQSIELARYNLKQWNFTEETAIRLGNMKNN